MFTKGLKIEKMDPKWKRRWTWNQLTLNSNERREKGGRKREEEKEIFTQSCREWLFPIMAGHSQGGLPVGIYSNLILKLRRNKDIRIKTFFSSVFSAWQYLPPCSSSCRWKGSAWGSPWCRTQRPHSPGPGNWLWRVLNTWTKQTHKITPQLQGGSCRCWRLWTSPLW